MEKSCMGERLTTPLQLPSHSVLEHHLKTKVLLGVLYLHLHVIGGPEVSIISFLNKHFFSWFVFHLCLIT